MSQTLAKVNKLIAKEGMQLELVKGKGYFYFIGPEAEHARDASVAVCCLGHLDNEEWLHQARMVRRDHNLNKVSDEDMENNPIFQRNHKNIEGA